MEKPIETPAEAVMNEPEPVPEIRVPSKVTGLEAFATEDRVVLFWTETSELWVSGYRVYRAEGDGEFESLAVTQTPAFIDPWPGKPYGPAKSRFYKVRAIGPDGEGGTAPREGPFSEPVTISLPK